MTGLRAASVHVADATLIASQLARVDWRRVFTLDTHRYLPAYLSAAQTNRLAWPAFADVVPSLYRHGLNAADLEVVIVPKSVTWSDRDANVYVGSADGPPVRSYLDLSDDHFVAVFAWHIAVGVELAAVLGRDVYVTHGFNPLDSSPDAHSAHTKFHTHVHVPDLGRRRRVVVSALSQFERLMLIEPYTVVLWDRLHRLLDKRGSASRWRAVARLGFVSLFTPLDDRLDDDLRVLAEMLADVHRTYVGLVEVFTDGETEQTTGHGRFIPRPRRERHRRLATFTTAQAGWLSDESVTVLRYLAHRMVGAQPREAPSSTRIATAGQAWIANGLSGALNFVVPARGGVLRFDIAPRVISTSGATKVISIDPTIIRKDRGAASPADQVRMRDFHRAVVAAATAAAPSCAS